AFDAGDFSQTLALIEKAKPNGSIDPDLCLLAADCYRHYALQNEFEEQVSAAKQLNGNLDRISDREELFKTQQGSFEGLPSSQLRALEKRGISEVSALEAVAIGSLASGRAQYVLALLDPFLKKKNGASDFGYHLLGRYLHATGQSEQAATELRNLLIRSPRMESAWMALADVYSRGATANIERAYKLLSEIHDRFPNNPIVVDKLARALRSAGMSSEAIELINKSAPSLVAKMDPFERVELDLDRGKYKQAVDQLTLLGKNVPQGFREQFHSSFRTMMDGQVANQENAMEKLLIAATALALDRRQDDTSELFKFGLNHLARIRRIADLRVQQVLAPNEPIVDQLLREAEDLSIPFPAPVKKRQAENQVAEDMGLRVYLAHCAQCHGDRGDGYGRAARFLTPTPRSFTAEPMRYVSSVRGLATDEDLAKTITKGLYGASMPAFPQLSKDEVISVIGRLRAFQRNGLRNRYQARSNAEIDTSGQEDWIQVRMEPGPALDLPSIAEPTDQSIQVGKYLFQELACNKCHQQSNLDRSPLFNDSMGRTIHARNSATEPMRRGRDPSELYKRIVLGIPGTPHPSLSGLEPNAYVALAHFVISISISEQSSQTNQERASFR
ncbi:MAG TPA: c-type cytochrome, partial [Pirellula sp.]|nr:c-type cytochrome [Pirellula sp.]